MAIIASSCSSPRVREGEEGKHRGGQGSNQMNDRQGAVLQYQRIEPPFMDQLKSQQHPFTDPYITIVLHPG